MLGELPCSWPASEHSGREAGQCDAATSCGWPSWNSTTSLSGLSSAGPAPARSPAVKSVNSFDSLAIASVNKPLVMELARCDYIQYRENVITLCNNGIGKSHIASG